MIVALFLIFYYRVLGVVATIALLHLRAVLLRGRQADPDHAGPAGHRRPDPDARRRRQREPRRVRAAKRRRGPGDPGTAIMTGYRKGLTAIIDANIVTFLVAFVLFIIATAGVRGFAFTLGLGVIVSLFTAVLATQAILYSLRNTRLIQSQGRARRRRAAGQLQDRLHGEGEVVLLHVRRDPARVRAGAVQQGHQLRHRLRGRRAHHRAAGAGCDRRPGARRAVPDGSGRREDPDADQPRSWARTSSRSHRGGRRRRRSQPGPDDGSAAENPSVESIGPSFGETVANSAIRAIIVSLLIISIYISLRFQWKVAVPVLIALMHDILIVAGVYAFAGREVTTSTVAALLTILGYSLYDTIIVFDRIRENIPRMPSAAYSQIVNRSLSEVIVRSIATSFCTLLPVLALLLFGGETLQDFAFALLIGIASGTYSSIFIATPVLQHWKEREPGFRARRARIQERLGEVPAYATTEQGGPIDVPPKERKRHVSAPRPASRSRRPSSRRWSGPRVEEAPASPRPSRRRRGPSHRRPAAGARAAGGRRPAAGGAAVRRHRERRHAQGAKAAQPTSREATLMAFLVWTMVGLALGHFTVFLPDKF